MPTPDAHIHFDDCPAHVEALVEMYLERLALPRGDLRVTTSRQVYRSWIGRLLPPRYGGAYCFVRRLGVHAVLINLDRIDQARPRAVEIVIAEELIHMRDHLDGDHRRHAHHGHDRIAYRVAEMTGVSLDEVRSALKPAMPRPLKYLYRCPHCQLTIARRRKGTWSCPRCAPRFDRRYVLRIIEQPS